MPPSGNMKYLYLLITIGLAALIMFGCSKLDGTSLRIGDPGQTREEREIFQDKGKVCNEELENKGKC